MHVKPESFFYREKKNFFQIYNFIFFPRQFGFIFFRNPAIFYTITIKTNSNVVSFDILFR